MQQARALRIGVLVVLVGLRGQLSAEAPFATRVIDYSPAPGQWVNDPDFNDPTAALGRPHAGGFARPDHSSLVSLGGFGGSVTLAFDHTVLDDPLNRFGMDAIVFSNAFWVGGNPNRHWAECATIEISLDVNENGLADDPWYLIPGSHIVEPVAQFAVVTWDDDVDDATYPPDSAAWIPPDYAGTWTTQAYELPYDLFGSQVVVVNPSGDPDREGIFGYAEYSPTLVLGDLDGDNVSENPDIAPEDFHTVPDDPLTVGIAPGSGGGDAFDIAWAIDPSTGKPADLPGFDFIRLTTAVNAVDAGSEMGEKSAEIDAVADAAPYPFGDCDSDDDSDMVDIAGLQKCFAASETAGVECDRFDCQPDGYVDLQDLAALVDRLTGPR